MISISVLFNICFTRCLFTPQLPDMRNPVSFSRLVAGGLMLPFISSAVGRLCVRDMHPLDRTLLGGEFSFLAWVATSKRPHTNLNHSYPLRCIVIVGNLCPTCLWSLTALVQAAFSPGLAGVIFLAAKGLAKHYYRMCKGEAMARRRVLSFHQT